MNSHTKVNCNLSKKLQYSKSLELDYLKSVCECDCGRDDCVSNKIRLDMIIL